ncbi:SLC13 family permease [Aliidiomarina soli]|uniref:SLC13 family permease n=1 Tax=Aliidiomarina soli TaxID=1928574 RepID=A0A432WIU0_9GAMM|nr:SLC13 family permease [Aliidiomarina soli]RUO33693.1 SLC13 family permease [Aliidiomarina soli]
MNLDQILILLVLLAAMIMFIWGNWRHDMVALGALLACVFLGLVPADIAFTGFGHPAVITVACVLVLSSALQASGAVDVLAQKVLPKQSGPTFSIAMLTGLATLMSAFMNNVGAMALLMPIAIQLASRLQLPPGRVLMPVSFGSILGGMTTLIGTPPNLIVSGFRIENGQSGFAMFDYTPVGALIALAGVVFVALLGWRLVPARERADASGFDTAAYITEVRVREGSKAEGLRINELEKSLDEHDAQVVGILRGNEQVTAPHPQRRLKAEDVLVIEADPESLGAALSSLGLKLEESQRPKRDEDNGDEEDAVNPSPKVKPKAFMGRRVTAYSRGTEALDDEDQTADEKEDARQKAAGDVVLLELAVLPDGDIIGRAASELALRTRYSVNLLAVSRQGTHNIRRIRHTRLRAGDVLLMQGDSEALAEFASVFGCVPLAERSIRVPNKRKAMLASLVMAGSIAGAAFGLLPAAITFAAGTLAVMALKVVAPRKIYSAIDWPVIVLLAALIPVAGAMTSTGTADLLANFLLAVVAQENAIIALTAILIITMVLSDFMNNAATAAVMCPIALSSATALSVNSDTFLMAVAIGASCAFLTPIGHQNNTLILGPGGFKFGDYWRLGVPLEVIVLCVGIPALLLFWPL